MSKQTSEVDICSIDDILPSGGVAALVAGEQIAIFRLGESHEVFALANYDPFSDAAVLSRGIVGSINGKPVVASPIYKQHFELANGRCVEDESVTLQTWPVSVENGRVIVQAAQSLAA